MNEIIKEIRKLAKSYDKESKKRKIDVQSEEHEMGIIREIIKEAFSPVFNESEIPEVLFPFISIAL